MKCKILSINHKSSDWGGKALDFSALLKKKLNGAKDITFIIGGAHGVSKDILTKADLVLSASSLAFPHRIFKILLMDQIFRASSTIKNHPYYR